MPARRKARATKAPMGGLSEAPGQARSMTTNTTEPASAATNRRDHCKDEHAEEIDAFSPSREHAGHGCDVHSEVIEDGLHGWVNVGRLCACAPGRLQLQAGLFREQLFQCAPAALVVG